MNRKEIRKFVDLYDPGAFKCFIVYAKRDSPCEFIATASRPKGYRCGIITIYPKFLLYDKIIQQAVLLHEIGHIRTKQSRRFGCSDNEYKAERWAIKTAKRYALEDIYLFLIESNRMRVEQSRSKGCLYRYNIVAKKLLRNGWLNK